MVESYITHVRVTEDAAYPSTPAPPNSPPENKKHRIIIVAVRRSGRVRMHKARENNDGSFSIGKTWMLDDLVSIQSYSALVATTPLEQQQKEWASNVGFIVTIGKPYYWQAPTSKEKDFFIASLVKIYKKYTGGKVPNLIGFDDRERQLLTGGGGHSATSASKGSSQATHRPDTRPSSSQGSRPQTPYSSRVPSRDGNKEIRRQPPEEPALRHQPSRDQLQKPPPSRDGKAVPELKPLRTQDLGSDFNREREALRPTTPAEQSRPAPQSPAGSFGQRSLLSEANGKVPTAEARVAPVGGNRSNNHLDPKASELPASLRPGSSGISVPKTTSAVSETTTKTTSTVSETTTTTTATSTESTIPPLQGRTEPPAETAPASSSPVSPPEKSASPEKSVPEKPDPEPAETQEEDKEQEVHRPGLGPMVKKKKLAGKDLAGAFRKAATAYGAFKPRPGGAAERLMASKPKNKDEPDGITSVVPAPSLRALSSEPAKSSTPETPAKETPAAASTAQEPPKVEVTRSATGDVTQPADDKDEAKDAPKDGAQERSKSPRRRKRREDNTAKYCQALGIDPSILGGRGADFDDILTDLGWNGRLSDDKKIEDLEADVRREIGRVQASSWLGNLEQQEGKVDQLAKLIDKTIEECEVLDGLLTLYSHELNVRSLPHRETEPCWID